MALPTICDEIWKKSVLLFCCVCVWCRFGAELGGDRDVEGVRTAGFEPDSAAA